MLGGLDVAREPAVGGSVIEALRRQGHHVPSSQGGGFGRGQMIWRLDPGVYAAATEPRADGGIAAW